MSRIVILIIGTMISILGAAFYLLDEQQGNVSDLYTAVVGAPDAKSAGIDSVIDKTEVVKTPVTEKNHTDSACCPTVSHGGEALDNRPVGSIVADRKVHCSEAWKTQQVGFTRLNSGL